MPAASQVVATSSRVGLPDSNDEGVGGRLLAAKRDGDHVLGRDRQGLLQELEELKKLKKAVD
eukprot:COSAG01_NODE_49_length_31891_cov_29.945773_28_plen_62_part_00